MTAAGVVQRLADYRPAPRFHELWRERVETLGVDDELKRLLLDENAIDDVLAQMPAARVAGHLHACTHTTFSCNTVGGPPMKTNVIPDTVELGIDIRTLPGEGHDEVTEHLRMALGDLFDRVEIEVVMNDPSSMSRTDTPLWDSIGRAIARPFPTARTSPQFIVGFTDARIFRSMGSVAYGAGLFSPNLDAGEFGRRFHGNDERVDVDSLRLTTQFWVDVVTDLLG